MKVELQQYGKASDVNFVDITEDTVLRLINSNETMKDYGFDNRKDWLLSLIEIGKANTGLRHGLLDVLFGIAEDIKRQDSRCFDTSTHFDWEDAEFSNPEDALELYPVLEEEARNALTRLIASSEEVSSS